MTDTEAEEIFYLKAKKTLEEVDILACYRNYLVSGKIKIIRKIDEDNKNVTNKSCKYQ